MDTIACSVQTQRDGGGRTVRVHEGEASRERGAQEDERSKSRCEEAEMFSLSLQAENGKVSRLIRIGTRKSQVVGFFFCFFFFKAASGTFLLLAVRYHSLSESECVTCVCSSVPVGSHSDRQRGGKTERAVPRNQLGNR